MSKCRKAKRSKKEGKGNSLLDLRPRVRIEWNTGTRVILSKKDKSKMRRILKSQLQKEMSKI